MTSGSALAERPAAVRTAPLGDFVPARWLSNGHAMTLAAWARARVFPDLPTADARVIRVASDTEVLAHCYWQRDRASAPTLIALHGLEGSSSVRYMRGLADKAIRRGWNAVLLNQRNCGGTEHLTPHLYHSGLTDDPRAVIRALMASDRLSAFAIVGYSLGGNLATKLAGELAQHPDVPVHAVAAVCPTIDLDLCVRAIERRANIPYQFNFVRNLRARMRRKAQAWPNTFDLAALGSIWTIRRFDDVYTAPLNGFGDASTYYHQASAIRVVDRIAVPTLIVAAQDDPFVPPSQFGQYVVADNPHVTVRVTKHGGHCGFIAAPDPRYDGYWAEEAAIEFADAVMRERGLVA